MHNQFLLDNLIVVASLILAAIALHAWTDANEQLRKTEALYNNQPRIKPRKAKLKWTGRIVSFLTFKR